MKISNALWANNSFLKNPHHLELLEELISLEMMNGTIQLLKTEHGIHGMKLPFLNSMHWSRQFEWPWAITEGNILPKDVILEVGGGDTVLQFALAKRCRAVINVDHDNEVLETIRNSELNKLLPVTAMHLNGEKLPYQDNSFDKVFCISVMEHSENPLQMAKELYRVLKTNGKLICTMDIVPNVVPNVEAITLEKAVEILEYFDINFPPVSGNAITCAGLIVLCFSIVKDDLI